MRTRRTLLMALGTSALNWPLRSLGQHLAKVWRVGFLGARAVPPAANPDPMYLAFLQALRDLGYVEGKNLEMVWRSSGGVSERLPKLAAELVESKVDVILTTGSTVLSAVQKVTATVPIVFTGVGDPVALGFVESLARPGKNITGASNLAGDLSIKSLEFLAAAVPRLARVAVLLDPANPFHAVVLKQALAAARPAGIDISVFEASDASQLDAAFAVIPRARVGAMIVAPDFFFVGQARQIAEFEMKSRIPTIYSFNAHVEAGGLMSYGENVVENIRRGAPYVDKILRGAKPADLPVEQPTVLELVINLKTAKALGLTLPVSLLTRANRLIE